MCGDKTGKESLSPPASTWQTREPPTWLSRNQTVNYVQARRRPADTDGQIRRPWQWRRPLPGPTPLRHSGFYSFEPLLPQDSEVSAPELGVGNGADDRAGAVREPGQVVDTELR